MPPTSYTIVLSLPAKELSPNWRGHWAVKDKARKAARSEAWAETYLRLQGRDGPRWKAASIQYTFFFKDKRTRDDDNFASRCKPIRDGIADAGMVCNDSQFTTLPVQMFVDHESPRLQVTVTEMP